MVGRLFFLARRLVQSIVNFIILLSQRIEFMVCVDSCFMAGGVGLCRAMQGVLYIHRDI